jgi:hypothetical protein
MVAIEGQNTFNLNVGAFEKGSFIVEVINGTEILRKEFIVVH